MKYMGYWAVGALTRIAGCRLAGGRRQALAQSVAFLPCPGCCCFAPSVSAIQMKSTQTTLLMETTSSKHAGKSKLWLIC